MDCIPYILLQPDPVRRKREALIKAAHSVITGIISDFRFKSWGAWRYFSGGLAIFFGSLAFGSWAEVPLVWAGWGIRFSYIRVGFGSWAAGRFFGHSFAI
jgi:hypothetical protein